ncbi:LysR family transcriptional regulator [Pelotomaculum propionicicum]|uniref:HTH-type transcriptional activator CmpR n=1 Tax=Pelotomaculum propionicicum TaxID=258475 RepID=A0A4Y7RJX9_9FIRM|nr:LysR family transcriptional regulator [Pelotomaculum propionicicum]NLI12183.1 LysR family transcriptional regulator [Peptococcaceae bacterium]TEB09050.1 HTH-type transcriptional activator CmpR [Pelotomaculum propionicicum]
MTIHQMRILQKVIETQSFSAAGESLLLSQPSVSAQIKSFENSLGLILIDRQQSNQTNGIVLTEEGRFVFEAAQRILTEWDKIIEYSKSQKDKITVIKLITNSPIGTYLLPELLPHFNSIYPNVKIKLLMETNYNSLTKLIKSKSYDLCIAPLLKNILPHVNVIYKFQIPIVLVNALGGFNNNNIMPLNDLNNYLLILPPSYSTIREVLNTFFAQLPLKIKSSMELDHAESVKRVLLQNTNYFGLISSISVNNELKTGSLQIIQTDPPLPQTEYIIFNQKGKSLQTDAIHFVEYLKKNIPIQ